MVELVQRDTIAAIATPAGAGGIGIIRISGWQLESYAIQLFGKVPTPRMACFTAFRDENGQILDEGLVLYFPSPRSYTGEDVLELQGHGGTIVLNAVLHRCLQLGARIAKPGEFTYRAYLNQKLDLAQAESVVDLIHASSIEAVKCATRSLQGEFSTQIFRLVEHLESLRVQIETALDFADEALDFIQQQDVAQRLATLRQDIATIEQSSQRGSILREGIHLVLVGQPNVGKSSLLNQLAGNDRAIVTPVAGTTRDTIRESLLIEGIVFHVIDTAGLRETLDPVEQAGIDRTRRAIEQADVVLLLADARSPQTSDSVMKELPQQIPCLRVFNKADLLAVDWPVETNTIYISAKTGQGCDHLRRVLVSMVAGQVENSSAFLARSRHLDALRQAKEYVICASEKFAWLELMAEDLRLAQGALMEITGPKDADDLLGKIFSEFCIGK